MTWVPLLLKDPSPCLRYLVLKELLNRSEEDPEVKELSELREEDPLVNELNKLQRPSGAWNSLGNNYIVVGDNLYITSLALQRLGYLGFDSNYPPIRRASEYIFSKQQKDGSWPLSRKKKKRR